MIYEINHIWTAEMKWKWRNDRRSECNLCNCVKKPGNKKFWNSMEFEPITSRYWCDALPTELWSHWHWHLMGCWKVWCFILVLIHLTLMRLKSLSRRRFSISCKPRIFSDFFQDFVSKGETQLEQEWVSKQLVFNKNLENQCMLNQ